VLRNRQILLPGIARPAGMILPRTGPSLSAQSRPALSITPTQSPGARVLLSGDVVLIPSPLKVASRALRRSLYRLPRRSGECAAKSVLHSGADTIDHEDTTAVCARSQHVAEIFDGL
jgi:hypothetical protein